MQLHLLNQKRALALKGKLLLNLIGAHRSEHIECLLDRWMIH